MSYRSISSLPLIASLTVVAAFALGCATGPSAEPAGPVPVAPDPELTPAPEATAEPGAAAEDASPMSDEAEISPGVTVTGQPTKAQLEAAAARGVKVVINLRGADEPGVLADEKAIVEGAGMTYVQWDAGKGPAVLTEENARKLGEAMAGDGPVMVHCSGGNRAAALVGLKAAVVDGKSEADVSAMVEGSGRTKMLIKLQEAIAAHAAKAAE